MASKDPNVIFRPWITVKGKRIYASQYGLRAFAIRIDPNKPRKSK